jgi:predicted lipid-binding transport protein (Tim44 family)
MKTLIAFTLALLAATLVTLPDAEARRFGGGMNLGKQYSMPRTAAPKTQQAAPSGGQAAAAQGRPSGASRWLGPLAGLAAGGLLASLLFGDAFEGLQMMDILLFAALAIGGVMLFRAMRRGRPSPAAAFGGLSGGAGLRTEERFLPPDVGGAVASATAGEDEAPMWFDGPAFVEAAKTHFVRLQAAWDQSDFRDIREYTAPQLFAELQRERERLGPAQQYTEVVRLNAELLGVRRDGDLAIASVRFTGLIREEESAGAGPFDEIWHVQHPWATRDGDWLIAGIQQGED